MNDLEKPFIDFYNQHHIIPVAQDISDLKQHFERRNALYRHCGIPSFMIGGRSVLEVGPGTGHNALFTNSLCPRRYVLVDGAKAGIDNLTRLFKASFKDLSNCEIIESGLEDLKLNEDFDIVLCEGAIPFQKNPSGFLKTIAGFAGPSGIVMITCADAVSYFSEILRRIMGLLILETEGGKSDLRKNMEILKPYFTTHLSNLKGMSRPVDDWIYDNILQPFLGVPFSIAEAIEALDTGFDIYGSSPSMFVDWRWYKDIHGPSRSYNPMALNIFWQNINNLLDYRYVFSPCDQKTGQAMMNICNQVFSLSIELQNSGVQKTCLETIRDHLSRLCDIVSVFSRNTAASIKEFEDSVNRFINGSDPDFKGMTSFPPWFGRGQQYVSFIRKD